MRSIQLLQFHKYVSELNTHYSHFLFISQEFIDQNSDNIKNNRETDVQDFFSQNVYASQFNVKLEKLPEEFENTKQFILRSLFMLSYFQ